MIVLATAAILSCAEVQQAVDSLNYAQFLSPVQRQEIVLELLAVSEAGCAPNGVAGENT